VNIRVMSVNPRIDVIGVEVFVQIGSAHGALSICRIPQCGAQFFRSERSWFLHWKPQIDFPRRAVFRALISRVNANDRACPAVAGVSKFVPSSTALLEKTGKFKISSFAENSQFLLYCCGSDGKER
jgi:hypothetical protein